ncbi:gamma-glutamylcyclotransferase [Cytobacillus purgationiresistens]|uniref:Gamma-glutamylcyclotransferase (GGCT)/AIG2-like uncharacterized protein YtfP n=1 Tax=Cytobacillus purgationiresistens TaxID=863449 RepID=A0ABU0AAX1_9BACI|nr:gamma-glutamylcyclotransferase [Cytobacillus purgationiresistens]MDQ0268406.1 gamma-glutamylcyclotransferase (GGCT)/AIG2-like uncharacterized protein YtfP [Cytobacillus purgationiresistens]
MENGAYLFVYGTLRKHEHNHHLLNNSICIAEQAWVFGNLFDSGQEYPTLMVKDKSDKVYGELYQVPSHHFKELDELEDYVPGRKNNLYERIEQTVFTDAGEKSAFVYVIIEEPSQAKKIRYGDWKLYHLINNCPETTYYFAYGSCMDTERFSKAQADQYFMDVKGAAVLINYSMGYTFKCPDGGRADIIEGEGETEGILYEIPYEGVEYLFEREGFHEGSYRPAFVDVQVAGKVIKDVLTFHVYNKKEEFAPPVHYATEILRGAKGRVSQAYYQQLLKKLEDLEVKMNEINV